MIMRRASEVGRCVFEDERERRKGRRWRRLICGRVSPPPFLGPFYVLLKNIVVLLCCQCVCVVGRWLQTNPSFPRIPSVFPLFSRNENEKKQLAASRDLCVFYT